MSRYNHACVLVARSPHCDERESERGGERERERGEMEGEGEGEGAHQKVSHMFVCLRVRAHSLLLL